MDSDYNNPKDPYTRPKSDPGWRNDSAPVPTWGWIVGGIAVVLVLAFVFGMNRDATTTATNDVRPPVTSPRVVTPSTPPAAIPPATTGQAPSATPPSTTGQNPN
jgi:hypothetical protein